MALCDDQLHAPLPASPSLLSVRLRSLLCRYFGRSQSEQANGNSGSPASAAHKGRILCEELSSLLGLQPPMGILESEATEGAIRELVWSNAAYQIKLCFLPARSLHNWHEQMHKSYHAHTDSH